MTTTIIPPRLSTGGNIALLASMAESDRKKKKDEQIRSILKRPVTSTI